MSGASIAAEINAALLEVARDTGDGELLATFYEPAPQPQNPWEPTATDPTEHELRVMVSDFPLSMIDGTLIQKTDKRLMVSATGAAVKVNWRVTVGGTNYAIMGIREIGPGGVALYYDIQARA